MKQKTKAEIVKQSEISPGIFDLSLRAPLASAEAVPGQFINLFLNDKSRLLPRPISLCGIDREKGELRLVYRVSGSGTKELSEMRPGEEVFFIGPLGNGFPLEEAAGKSVYLVGGGIGIPPLLETAKELNRSFALKENMRAVEAAEAAASISSGVEREPETAKTVVTSVLGYRSDTFLRKEFEKQGTVLIATEDGSTGTAGTVIDAMNADGEVPDVIFACGPVPMLRALKKWAAENKVPLWVSMEERMACGIGACLACVCKTTQTDEHSHVHNARVCKDGPVFYADAIEL